MAFQFFLIPIQQPDPATAELNQFLRSHRIIRVERQWIDQGSNSLWSFCVEFTEGPDGTPPPIKSIPQRNKVDYKETMSPEDFAIFAKLRDLRKEIAQAESVPVYTIFTNEQLSQMVLSRAVTRAALAKIDGIGDARLDKYAAKVLGVLSSAWPIQGGSNHEASGSPLPTDSRKK